jgi:hypothetical protein
LEASATKAASVFSDNCTRLLGTSNVTLGLSTAMFGLSTTNISTTRRSSREMVMVHDESFPHGAWGKFTIMLHADVRKALAAIAL